MSFRSWVLARLSGPDVETDPDEPVEIARVDLASGPMMKAKLERAGLFAHGEECFSVLTRSNTDYRILVHRQDAAAATAILDS